MAMLHEKLKQILPSQVEEIKEFQKTYGETQIDTVNVGQAFGGMRGIKGILCDTSEVPADKGLIIRGTPISELTSKSPEDIFWLLLTGSLPTAEESKDLHNDLKSREAVPAYVWNVIDTLPKDTHPMTMFNTALLVMQNESVFAKKYDEGMKKGDYWEATLEDALNIMARVPAVAAYIYRLKYADGKRIESNPNADMGTNYVHMLGLGDPDGKFSKMMSLYLTCLSDHEGGNVSSFAAATINSALSDLYYTLSGGFNGLAGPLHGLAVQECLKWVLETMEDFGGAPTHEQLEKFTWDTLNAGKVVPGYGHAVLRVTDPRFTAFLDFGKEHCPEDPVFKTVATTYDVVPMVLKQIPKISNPWPNVDASSGALFYHYGLKEFDYYTVVFAVSRTIGIAAQSIIARAYGMPITRPKSMPLSGFKKAVGA